MDKASKYHDEALTYTKKLIKDRAVSDSTIHELLLSKFITIKELSDTLPGDRFDEILKIVDPDYEVEKRVEKNSCEFSDDFYKFLIYNL